MTSAPQEADAWAYMQSVYEELDPPKNIRTELINGRIVMSPPAVGRVGGVLRELADGFLDGHLPAGTVILP